MAIKTIARYNWQDKLSGDVHKNDIRWDYDAGGFALCTGLDAYAQTIEAAIKTVYGEMITKRRYGVPYFSTIFDSRKYVQNWASSVTKVVSELDFITSINSFVYEYDKNRKCMTYKMSVTTRDGNFVEVSES